MSSISVEAGVIDRPYRVYHAAVLKAGIRRISVQVIQVKRLELRGLPFRGQISPAWLSHFCLPANKWRLAM